MQGPSRNTDPKQQMNIRAPDHLRKEKNHGLPMYQPHRWKNTKKVRGLIRHQPADKSEPNFTYCLIPACRMHCDSEE